MVVGIVVVVVGDENMVNEAVQFSGGSKALSGSDTFMEHSLAGASPCTVMLRSAVASVAPMFMVLEVMVIYGAQFASTSITSLSICSWVASIISVLVKVTTTSSSTSVPDTVTEAGAMVMQSSEGTVVVVVPSAVVVVVPSAVVVVVDAAHSD